MKKVIVKLEHVSKSYNSQKFVVKDLNLDIYEGEFLTLLGPSGCGKTTILRMISGLEKVTEGKVYIDGKDVTDLDATKREVNTIFQNLALFPHLSTYDNIAFGLRMKKMDKKTIDKKVKEAIKLVELTGFEDRLPAQLSGGQQQRVAIARGIVMNPKVLLLDESLCSLDLKLKRAMQIELKKIQRRLGITFIYVTHDQDEALTMSDRIAVMDGGIIQQDDSPKAIYRTPKNVFVADFIGESNIFEAIVTDKKPGKTIIELDEGVKFNIHREVDLNIGDKSKILVRPENIKVYFKNRKRGIKTTINEVIYDGSTTKLFVTTKDNLKFRLIIHGSTDIEVNEEVFIVIEDKFVVFMV